MGSRRRLVLAGVGVLALAGGGTAIAAAAGHGHSGEVVARHGSFSGTRVSGERFGFAGPRLDSRRGFGGGPGRPAGAPGVLATAASYLGTTPADLVAQLRSGKTLAQIADATSGKSADGLIAALVAHAKQQLAAAVSAGRLNQAQADAISATLQQRFTDLVNGARPAFRGPGPGFAQHGPDLLATAASYLGTTPADLVAQLRSGKTLAQIANATSGKSAGGLIAALVAHVKQQLAAAVSAGRLTQAQADALSATLQERITNLVNGARPAFRGPGPGFPQHGPGLLAAAASYLGTTPADLVAQLRSGKTLAQIANATSGKSAGGLIAALVAHVKQQLAAAVSAGRLTQAQADAISANLEQRITNLVNGVRPSGRPPHPYGPGGDASAGLRI